jgi:NodT family efflux transporter outer membrane factor (OMF) lipoprotein
MYKSLHRLCKPAKNKRIMRRALFSSSSLALLAFVLAGCAVGPDFSAPVTSDITTYDSTSTPNKTSDDAQTITLGGDIPAEWWNLFHSESLNRLIDQAIKNNPDLKTAEASLRIAEDNLAAGDAALFPVISGNFSQTRQKTSSASNDNFFPGFTYSLYNASVGVSYGLDLFGGTRRQIEELQAQRDEIGFEREATYLTLTSNVVTASIQEASLRDQIEAAHEIISDQEKVLAILRARFDSGAVAKSAVLEQQATLATTKTTLPPLEHQLVVTRHLLSVLIGQMPANEPQAKFTLSDLTLPMDVPLTIPSRLVEQRPDVKEAEENLHAASAAIGVAVAARLPEITLTADAGSAANAIGKLFTPGGGFWSFGSSAAVTIFDAGALADQEDAARAAYDAEAAQYRKTVLGAFQNVADTLHALQSASDSLNARIEAEKAASDSLSLLQSQFKAGAVTMADLLNAEQTEQQAKAALVQARAQRYADTAALFAALGGGWWNRTPTAQKDLLGDTATPDALNGGTL